MTIPEIAKALGTKNLDLLADAIEDQLEEGSD